jgi:hypothetical protein
VATQVVVDLAQVSKAMAHRRGVDWSAQVANIAQVQAQFQAAQDEFRSGNQAGALDRLREGRRMVARAIEASGGPEAIQAMVERLQTMALTIANDPDEYQDPEGLQAEMGVLAQEAGKAWGSGDRIGAGQLTVLGEQRIRQRQRLDHPDRTWRAKLAVRLGGSAVELASRILEHQGASEKQLRFLEKAKEFQARAVAALETGKLHQAVHFACLAKWWSLKAVVGPGKATEEELRFMVRLAHWLLAEARVAVGPDPPILQEVLLKKAARLIKTGTSQILDGDPRGLGPVWFGSVICYFLLE